MKRKDISSNKIYAVNEGEAIEIELKRFQANAHQSHE